MGQIKPRQAKQADAQGTLWPERQRSLLLARVVVSQPEMVAALVGGIRGHGAAATPELMATGVVNTSWS